MEPKITIDRSELVYTTGIEFTVQKGKGSIVRLGPLAYITSDIDDDCDPIDKEHTRIIGPMEHRMCRGVYRVHRVKKNVRRNNGTVAPSQFTVIALDGLDPTKIVDSLEGSTTTITEDAWKRDLFFDNRRWLRFAGSRSPLIDKSRLKRLFMTRDDTKDNTPYRDSLRERLAVIAYVCKVSWSNEVSNTKQSVVTTNDMICGDRNTFYVRLLSKPMVGKLRAELASPDMSGFTVRCGRSRTPSLIGVYHDDGLGGGVCGYVMRTKTDMDRRPLPRDRVFAVVLGSAFLSSVGVVVVRVRGDRSSPDGDTTTFGHSAHCSDFLYEERKSSHTTRKRKHYTEYTEKPHCTVTSGTASRVGEDSESVSVEIKRHCMKKNRRTGSYSALPEAEYEICGGRPETDLFKVLIDVTSNNASLLKSRSHHTDTTTSSREIKPLLLRSGKANVVSGTSHGVDTKTPGADETATPKSTAFGNDPLKEPEYGDLAMWLSDFDPDNLEGESIEEALAEILHREDTHHQMFDWLSDFDSSYLDGENMEEALAEVLGIKDTDP